MEKKRYSLEMKESVKWAEILQIIFGSICIIVAVYLMIYISKSIVPDTSSWTGIYFMIIFGVYQIWSGSGYAGKYIEIDGTKIKLRNFSIGRAKLINASDIEKIESFPLNTVFQLKDKSKINLRFGVSYPERMETIVNEIFHFAEENNLVIEAKD